MQLRNNRKTTTIRRRKPPWKALSSHIIMVSLESTFQRAELLRCLVIRTGTAGEAADLLGQGAFLVQIALKDFQFHLALARGTQNGVARGSAQVDAGVLDGQVNARPFFDLDTIFYCCSKPFLCQIGFLSRRLAPAAIRLNPCMFLGAWHFLNSCTPVNLMLW